MRSVVSLSIAALAAIGGAQSASVPLTLLTDTSARCLDGTLSGYYVQPASTPAASRKWIIFLEGGGECTTQAACDAALSGPLGSSKYFAPSIYMPYFLSDDAASNPDFYDWNHVDVPYCSQDLHSGQVTSPSAGTFGLYFSGHFVMRAILAALNASHGLGDAAEIIVTGASAGGIGSWINVDYIGDAFPGARVTVVPIAGFYFYAYPYMGANHTSSELANFAPSAWPVTVALWQAFADETCVAARTADPWACMLANYSFPYIAAEAFVIEAQTDQVVLLDHDWLPDQYRSLPPEQAYMAEWSRNMSVGLAPLMNPANSRAGVFSPACFIHTDFSTSAPLINGTSYQQALGDWYFGRAGATKLADDCGIECNPTCPTGP